MSFVRACVRLCTLCNRALRMALKESLQHSKECRGVLGQASRQALRGHSVGAMPCRGLLSCVGKIDQIFIKNI